MREEQVRAALDDHLAQLSEPTAWENISFTPAADSHWIRPTFLPAEPSAAALGADAQNRLIGVYQVDVFWPIGDGPGPAGEKAETIMQQFKRGTVVTYNGTAVQIERAYREGGRRDGEWYHVPVVIDWFSYVDN